GAQQFAIASPELVDLPFHSARRQVELSARFRISAGGLLARQEHFQHCEPLALARRGVFLPQAGADGVEHGERPASLKDFLRAHFARWLQKVTPFSILRVQRYEGPAAAAFDGPSAVTFIGEKVPQRGQQEGAESAFLPFHLGQIVLFQKASEESLS